MVGWIVLADLFLALAGRADFEDKSRVFEVGPPFLSPEIVAFDEP